MFRRVEFENFMCLKNVGIDLEPLTVFIGSNGSGKSAIFKGLVTISRLLGGAPVRSFRGVAGVTFDDMVWNGNSGLPIRFRAWFAGDPEEEPGYTLELRKGREGWSVTRERIKTADGWIDVDENHAFEHPSERGVKVHQPPLLGTLWYRVNLFADDSEARPEIEPILQLAEKFGQAWRYRPSAIDIASFVPHPAGKPIQESDIASFGPRLGRERSNYVRENGAGLAAELQALQGSKREVFEAIENAVRRLFPHVKTIGFKSDWQGVRLTFRTDRSEDSIPAPQESDGVLLATFLFWRFYTGTRAQTICLEEPENGLHPFLLAERFQLLKQFAQQGAQLLVATHSPEFLRAVKAHPTALYKEIRLVEFAPGTGTCVRRLSHYRDATKLIEDYLMEVHERWKSVVLAWPLDPGETS